MKHVKYLFLTITLFLIGCSQKEVLKSDNSQTSLDWVGTYVGILPCADCEGIKTILTLNDNLTFNLVTTYLGKEENKFISSGNFKWDESGNNIVIDSDTSIPSKYKVGENLLFQLDLDGGVILGDLSEKYKLHKTSNLAFHEITDTKWKLIEIMGKPVSNNEEFYLQLNSPNKRFSAFAGCNKIFGEFILQETGRISFIKVASTRMACDNGDIETDLLKVLNIADNFSLNDGNLTLNKAKMAPLAKFIKY